MRGKLLIGAIVTTWSGGCGHVRLTDWSPLAGRIVCVWPDADDAGDRAAQEVIHCCVDADARAVWVLSVPEDWPKGADAADLTQPEVEDVWTSGTMWVGGTIDAAAVRARRAAEEAERHAERERRRRQPANPRHRELHGSRYIDAARAVPILELADRLGIEHRKGWALCPFHEDRHPSLHLNAKKNAAFCNPCGKSWDAIALVMELERLDFPAAVRWLLGEPEPIRRAG